MLVTTSPTQCGTRAIAWSKAIFWKIHENHRFFNEKPLLEASSRACAVSDPSRLLRAEITHVLRFHTADLLIIALHQVLQTSQSRNNLCITVPHRGPVDYRSSPVKLYFEKFMKITVFSMKNPYWRLHIMGLWKWIFRKNAIFTPTENIERDLAKHSNSVF